MFASRLKKVFSCTVMALFLCAFSLSSASAAEKIGVLFFGTGMDEEYKPDWLVGYFDHLFPVMGPGFFAGGDIEGGDCYTLIHYANEDEAEICGVAEGTPVDVFCNVYTDEANNPVHTVVDHFDVPTVAPDAEFQANCHENFMAIFGQTYHSTIDPVSGLEIIGPHVHSPTGAGIGVADFIEQSLFDRMEQMAVHFPNQKSPYREQWIKWMYGHDFPAAYGSWDTSGPEPVNIKDELLAAVLADPDIDPTTEIVFRNGWESYLENKDIYRNDAYIADSTETAIEELISDEGVDRIIVFSNGSTPSNLTNWGPSWIDKNGNGVSRIPGKTYRECVEDLTDAYGPTDQAELDALVADKPWDQYYAPFEDITYVVQDVLHDVPEADVELTFTETYGAQPEYDEGFLEIVKYTLDVKNGGIPDNSSIKVVLAHHGFYGGHKGGFWCDRYFESAEIQTQRVATMIEDYYATQSTRSFPASHGGFSVTKASNEFSQPGEGAFFDQATAEKPFGDNVGAGEVIDQSINGKYVNELGEVVDNGIQNYDYVVVIPVSWDGENIDTVLHLRADTLGNIDDLETIQNQPAWTRQHDDQSGEEYFADTTVDNEFYTFRSYDASGWCSVAASGEEVCKGSATNPTNVIITGALLSIVGAPAVRANYTLAAVGAITDAIKDPDIGGWLQGDLPPEITREPARVTDGVTLSTEPGAPTTVLGEDYIYWTYDDDQASCSGMTLQWQYRVAGTADPMTVYTVHPDEEGGGSYRQWVWTDFVDTLGTGTYEMQAIVTDCAGQSVTSSSYYFSVDMAPIITNAPALESSQVTLSTCPFAPTTVLADDYIYWTYTDDKATCTGITLQWQYRIAGSEDPMTVYTVYPDEEGGGAWGQWVWTDYVSTLGTGTYEMQAVVIDCAGQTTISVSYYITVDMPPEIVDGPFRTSDSAPLSTDPASPTEIAPTGSDIYWIYDEDRATCEDVAVHTWEYRTDDSQAWSDPIAGTAFQWAWVEEIGAVTGSGTFEFMFTITDCAGQATESDVHYISVTD